MTKNKTTLGILMMMAAVALLTVMNVLVKLIGPAYHPTQISFIRNAVAALVLLPLLLRSGGPAILKTSRPGTHFIRGLFGVTGNILYFFAFQRLPVGDVIVISQAVPLFVTIMAIVFLGEAVGLRRWMAVTAGFLGVLIAINPTGTIEIATLLAVAATALWAATILLVRALASTESPYTIAFYFMVLGALITGAVQPWYWQTPPWEMVWMFAGVGVVGAGGQLLMSYALKLAEASIVSPFNYTAILWAIAFDAVLWGVLPTWTTLSGAAIITGAGIYIFRREAALHKKAQHSIAGPP